MSWGYEHVYAAVSMVYGSCETTEARDMLALFLGMYLKGDPKRLAAKMGVKTGDFNRARKRATGRIEYQGALEAATKVRDNMAAMGS